MDNILTNTMGKKTAAHPLFRTQRMVIALAFVATIVAGTSGGTHTTASLSCNWIIKWGCSPLMMPTESPEDDTAVPAEAVTSSAAVTEDTSTLGPCTLYRTSDGFKLLENKEIVSIKDTATRITMIGDCPATVGVQVGTNSKIPVQPEGSVVSNGLRIKQINEETAYGLTRILEITPTEGGVTGGAVAVSIGTIDLTLEPADNVKVFAPVVAPVLPVVAVPTVEPPPVDENGQPLYPAAPPSPVMAITPTDGSITPTKEDICEKGIKLSWVACPDKTEEVFQIDAASLKNDDTTTYPLGLSAPVLPAEPFKGGTQSWDDFIKQLMLSIPMPAPAPSPAVMPAPVPVNVDEGVYGSPSYIINPPVDVPDDKGWFWGSEGSPSYIINPPIEVPGDKGPYWGSEGSPSYFINPPVDVDNGTSGSAGSAGSYSFTTHNAAMPPCYDGVDNSFPADQKFDNDPSRPDDSCMAMRERSPNPLGETGSCFDTASADEDHDGLINSADSDCWGPERNQAGSPSTLY